jgi:hypothetical protein
MIYTLILIAIAIAYCAFIVIGDMRKGDLSFRNK